MKRVKMILIIVLICLLGYSAYGAEWGNFSGRFVLQGEIPKPKPILVKTDKDEFSDSGLVDESLMINPKNRGIANIAVYLIPAAGAKVAAHPGFDKSAKEEVVIEARNGRYEPHMTLLRVGQPLRIANEDPSAIIPKIELIKNPALGPAIPARSGFKVVYAFEERIPGTVSCSIHPWMSGYVLIRGNPYMAKTDSDGRFEIKNLPVGKHVFQFWHERMGYVRNVALGDQTTSKKGRLELTITAGDNQLMTGLIHESEFK